MAKKIFILDDEPDIVNLIKINLEKAGFQVKGFTFYKDLFNSLLTKTPDLIVLDLMMPKMDGMEVFKKLRMNHKYQNIPVIMLTAKSDEVDKIIGLEMGADDYITKPFSPRELIARIKNILKRFGGSKLSEKISLGDKITINPHTYDVIVEDTKIKLTTAEFKILQLLMSKPGWVFSRDQILEYLWGNEKAVIDRTVDVHITNLRKKIKKAGDLIENIRGVGYKIKDEN